MNSTNARPPVRAASQNLTARALTDGHTVLATVDVPAPPERLFRALTTDECELWWGAPEVYRVTQWRAELFVGGRWSLLVLLPDGQAFPASGEFLEIDSPHKLVQTRRYDWDHPTLGRRDTTVTYLLDAMETGTRVTVRHDGFAGIREAADEHVGGWERFLDWLKDYMKTDRASFSRWKA